MSELYTVVSSERNPIALPAAAAARGARAELERALDAYGWRWSVSLSRWADAARGGRGGRRVSCFCGATILAPTTS